MKIKLIIATFLIVSLSNCKRYNNNDNSKEIALEKTSISKKEVQEVLSLKVNLINYGETGKYNIAIPSHYYATTTEHQKGNIDLTYGKLSSENKDGVFSIELKSAVLKDEDLANQYVYIVKEENPNLIAINDIKSNIISDANGFEMPILYEDKNSIIYDKDIKIITFNYDTTIKSYIIYQADVSRSSENDVNAKFNLAIHLLKNGKNLLNTSDKSEPFSTWQDYVINFPKAEINVFKNQFANVAKEVKVFLNKNETANIDNQNNYLYKSSSIMDLSYLNFRNAVKAKNIAAFDFPYEIRQNFESVFLNYDVDYKYNLQQFDNVDYFTIDDDFSSNREKLICRFEDKNKIFYIINFKVDAINKNFYITMLNYFAKHKTLETTSKI